MKIYAVRQLMLWSMSFSFAGIAVAGTAPRIEVLRSAEVRSECGCNFQFTNGRRQSEFSENTFLQWDTEDNAQMHIDGKLVQLKARHVRSRMKGVHPAIGDTDTFRLDGGAIEVIVNCITNQVCAADNDSCESTAYKAKVLVKTPAGLTALNATGACGC